MFVAFFGRNTAGRSVGMGQKTLIFQSAQFVANRGFAKIQIFGRNQKLRANRLGAPNIAFYYQI